jgi:alpha-ketoglutarate-dependent 2,4-dichlorophenoxyacetate dioxygenase
VQGRKLEKAMTIKVRQLHPMFVGEVSALDLAAGLPPQTVAELTRAIDRYAVLVFHGQSLNDDRLLALGRLFGNIEAPRNHRVERRLKHAELADISNLDAKNQLRARGDHRRLDALGNQLWHSDASFREEAGALSMLFAHVVPPLGGESEFADLRAAYDLLSPPMQTKIEGLVCEHSIFHSRGQLGHTDYTEEERAALPPAHHRLVRSHPGSKRPSTWARTRRTSSAGPCRMGGCCCAT